MKFNYSFSQNRIYTECPQKYKLSYVDRIKEPSNDNLDLGNAIHKLCEYEFWKLKGEQPHLDDAIKTVCSLKSHMYLKTVGEQLGEFFKDKKIVFTEPKIVVNGIVFKIDVGYYQFDNPNVLVLADFKVTKRPKTTDDVYKEAQLLCYRYAVANNVESRFPEDVTFDVVKVQYINILNFDCGEYTVSWTDPVDVSLTTAENVVGEMRENMSKIDNNEFTKNLKACRNWGKTCWYKQNGHCDGK